MFTPNQEQAASELIRVCPHGRPDRSRELDAGRLHRPALQDDRQARAAAGRRQVAGAVGHRSAAARAVPRATRSKATKQIFHFRYKSAEHWLEVFKTFYGPTHKAFASLDGAKQGALQADILELFNRMNRGGKDTFIAPSEYLEAVVTRR